MLLKNTNRRKVLTERNEYDELFYNQVCSLLRLRLEVAKEPLERTLVGVMVFPVFKVANMSAPSDLFGPIGLRGQDGFVQPDGKQDIGNPSGSLFSAFSTS